MENITEVAMVEPIDIGIWDFWMQHSTDERAGVYVCEKCGHVIFAFPHDLPNRCPACKSKG